MGGRRDSHGQSVCNAFESAFKVYKFVLNLNEIASAFEDFIPIIPPTGTRFYIP